MFAFLWLVVQCFLLILTIVLIRRGHVSRWSAALAVPVRSALRWSVRPLFALCCLFLVSVPYASAQAPLPPSGTINDTSRFFWNPANWSHYSDSSVAPCQAVSGYGAAQNIVGPAGEPSPCSYYRVVQGYTLSDGAAITKAVLSVLVVILAIWQGPRVLKKMLTQSAH